MTMIDWLRYEIAQASLPPIGPDDAARIERLQREIEALDGKNKLHLGIDAPHNTRY